MNDSSPRIVVICVNYFSAEDTVRFVNSIANCNDTSDVRVVIADNTGCFAKVENTARLSTSLDIQVVNSGANLGYFGGAHNALRVFTAENPEPDWVSVSNTDLEILDSNFFKRLRSHSDDPQVGVIAPSIFSSLSKQDQNPYMVVPPSRAKLAMLRFIFSNYLSVVIYHALWYLFTHSRNNLFSFQRVRAAEAEKKNISNIYAPHGSFMILSKEYFRKGGSLEFPCFLFGEECFVAEKAKDASLRVLFDPSMSVQHREHATTGFIPSRRMAQYMKESSKYLSGLYSREKFQSALATEGAAGGSRMLNMSFLNLIGNGIRVSVSFVTAVFASRWLGAEGFGIFNLIFGYTAFLNYFFTLGFDHSLTYYISRFTQEGRPDLSKAVLRVAISLSLIIGALTILGLLILLPRGIGPEKSKVFFLPSIVMVGQTLIWAIGSILAGYLRGHKTFLPTILREQIIFPISHFVLLSLAVYFLSYGVLGYSIGYALATLLSTLFVGYASWKLLKNVDCEAMSIPSQKSDHWYSWLRFSLPIGLTVALEPLLIWSCIIAAGWYVTADEIGHLAVANRLTIFVQFLFIAVTPIFTPYLAEYLHRGKDLKREYQKVVFWCTKWALLFSFVMLTAGDYVLKLFGPDYSGALLSLALILPGSIAEACFGITKYGLVLAGKNRINVFNQIIGLIIGFGGSVLLAPYWGAPGVALALSLAMVTVNVLRLIAFHRFFKVLPYSLHHLASLSVAAVPLMIICWLTYEMEVRGSQRLIAAIASFVIGFTLSFWSERQRILNFIKPKFSS